MQSENTLLLCPIQPCNRKYKTQRKLQQHIDKTHRYDTRNSNYYVFDDETKMEIYQLAAAYMLLIEEGHVTDPTVIKNLLPTHHDPAPDVLETMKELHIEFAHTIKTRTSDQDEKASWDAVMMDFQRFFNLGLPYNDTNFCPSLEVDFLWHAIMQKPSFYEKICKLSVGELIPHCAKFRSEEEDRSRYQFYLDVMQKRYPNRKITMATPNRQVFLDKYCELKDRQRRDEEWWQAWKAQSQKELVDFCTKAGITLTDHVKINYTKYRDIYENYAGYTGDKLVQTVTTVLEKEWRERPASRC